MYLSLNINDILDKNIKKFQGYVTYKSLVHRLNSTFKNFDDLKFKVVTYEFIDVNDYSLSGLYDHTKNKKYVIFNFSSHSNEVFFDNLEWQKFKFQISQVIHHESIHQSQYQYRSFIEDNTKIDFRLLQDTLDEERSYLSDYDEIDAYAHDIAMEIKFHYGHLDPYTVLDTISQKRKLSSYKYYAKIFKGCDWSNIKKRLLSKTYKWIQHV